MITFDNAFDRLIGHEGGYVNDPKDPGGETQWGISKRSYPHLDIKTLTREQAKAIYYVDFWSAMRLDKFYDGVMWQLFDFAVNSGISTTIREFQREIGAAPDGWWGPRSQAAVDCLSESDQIMSVLAARLDFMRKLKNWPDHGRGWAGRIAANLRYGVHDSD